MQNNGYVIDANWKRKFIPIWGAQIFSLLGSGLVQFALVWYITQQTGSAALLATATFVALLPDVLFAPFTGALVDRPWSGCAHFRAGVSQPLLAGSGRNGVNRDHEPHRQRSSPRGHAEQDRVGQNCG